METEEEKEAHCRWRNRKTLGLDVLFMLFILACMLIIFMVLPSTYISILTIILLLGIITGYGEMIMSKGKNSWLITTPAGIMLILTATQMDLLRWLPALAAGILIGITFTKIQNYICKKTPSRDKTQVTDSGI